MAYEQKDYTGSLFKNDRRESDSHPDYKGSALIGGVDHWLDAWINTDRNGNKYMSLKLKPKQASSGRGESKQPYDGGGYPKPGSYSSDGRQGSPMQRDELDDDVPF